MKRLLSAGFVLSLAVAASGCMHGGDWGGSAFKATSTETRALAKNGHFSLDNTNGRVEVTGWDEAQVKIEATKRAGSEHALEQLKIEIEGEGDSLSRSGPATPGRTCFGGSGRVDYVVHVPRTARVRRRRTSTGASRSNDVAAAVEARRSTARSRCATPWARSRRRR